MSCVAKGLRFFVAVLVRIGSEEFGELKGKVGLVEKLSETERETLSTRGTAISWAGVMVKYHKFQVRMRIRWRYGICSGLPSLRQSPSRLLESMSGQLIE